MKNNKSLLLGSAAVLISSVAATGGARAADAIIIEPEPVEYVRVCDAYGAGWWYIPGTETCIRIGGYVRSTYKHVTRDTGDEHEINYPPIYTELVSTNDDTIESITNTDFTDGVAIITPSLLAEGPNDSFNESEWDYRGRLNIEARNETEWGTLSSYLRLQGGDAGGNADAAVGVDRALISIAGFRLGYSDTYWTTNHGYAAGSPITGAAIADLYYGFDQAVFFDYTYAANGLALTVGVQDSGRATGGWPARTSGSAPTTDTLDVYGGFNWSTDFGTYAFTAIYDATAEEAAYKASAIIPLGNWNIGGFYSWDDGSSNYVRAYFSNQIDQEYGVAIWGDLTETFQVYGGYSAASGDFVASGQNQLDRVGDLSLHQWHVGAAWTPVSGLTVNFEYSREERQGDLGRVQLGDYHPSSLGDAYDYVIDDEADAFIVRVTRSW
jgi:hypothetical protein